MLRLVLILAVFLALGTGCARQAASSAGPKSLRIDARLTPRETLEQLAAAELAATNLGSSDVPVPTGLEPTTLAPRDEADARAWMAHDPAIEQIVSQSPALLPTPPSPRQITPESRAEALRRYAHGREAALEGKYLVAATELQKALELDPDSTSIMRELARLYGSGNAQVSNVSRAMELYQRLADLEPDNDEAAFTVGLAAASRREFERAAATLGPWRKDGRSFRHDPAADLLADFTLATCFRELGYDRASIDAAARSLGIPDQLDLRTGYGPRVASVFRQRGETWRHIGDAHCRLAEYAAALEAYGQAARLPVADPSALHARVLFANLRLGRVFNAQRELLAALRNSVEGVSERDLQLCAYLAKNAQPIELLAQIVAEMHRGVPDDAGMARAAALLAEPAQAQRILRDFVARSPRDMEAVGQLLAWLAKQDVSSATTLTVNLIADHPDLADDYANRLARAVPHTNAALAVVRSADTHRASAAGAFLEARLLAGAGDLGGAWTVSRQARSTWPDDRSLLVQQIQLSAALEDTSLLEGIVRNVPQPDAATLVAIAQAHRSLGQLDRALEAAEAAVNRDSENFDAHVELARVHVARATQIAAQSTTKAPARADVDAAIRAADRAISLDAMRDEPYEVLAMLYSPRGVFADRTLLEQTRQRLLDAYPQSALYARMMAQELIESRRYDQAIERLLALYDADPANTTVLSLLIAAWELAGKLDAAEQWLNDQLADRSADSALLDQWARVKLRQDRAEQAIERLKADLKNDPENIAARRTLETVYRAVNRMDDALELGEQRLQARPEGPRRAVELAALYAGAARNDEAFAQLQWLLDHPQAPTLEQFASAIAIVGRVQNDDQRREATTMQLVGKTIERFPEAPLQVYGSGLRALARQGRVDGEFDDLTQRAVKNAERAAGASLVDVMAWHGLAQGLVDDGHPTAAARALRVRLRSPAPLDDVSKAFLGIMILTADAAAGNQVEQTIALIKQLDQRIRGQWTFLPGQEPPVNLADAYYQASSLFNILGDDAGSERLLRESLALRPENAMAMNNLGYKIIAEGRNEPDAVAWVERAFSLQPDDPNILDTMGWLRYKQGRFGKVDAPAESAGGAVELILASLRITEVSPRGDGGPEVLDHLGDAYWRLGESEKAVDAWRRVISAVEDSTFRDQLIQGYGNIQRRYWQLLAVDPRAMFDREYSAMLDRVKRKIAAAESGQQPPVSPTFEEQAASASP